MKMSFFTSVLLLILTILSCDSPDEVERMPEENPSELVDHKTTTKRVTSEETASHKQSDEEIARVYYDRMLIPASKKEDEPLILVLESLRHFYISDLDGQNSHNPLVFVYRFDPQYSFRKISVSINDHDRTIGALMKQIEAQVPVKLRLEGNMWVFENAELSN